MRSKGTVPIRAFTLIELLVVIAIIGLLSSIVIASLNTARAKARNAQRLSTLHQIANALNLAADTSGLPSTGGVPACLGTSGSCWGGAANGNAALNTLLQPFMASIPADPSHTSGVGDRYLYMDSATTVAQDCNGLSYPQGPFIFWEPDVLNPTSDALCPGGYYGCCATALGCSLPGGNNYYCVLPVR